MPWSTATRTYRTAWTIDASTPGRSVEPAACSTARRCRSAAVISAANRVAATSTSSWPLAMEARASACAERSCIAASIDTTCSLDAGCESERMGTRISDSSLSFAGDADGADPVTRERLLRAAAGGHPRRCVNDAEFRSVEAPLGCGVVRLALAGASSCSMDLLRGQARASCRPKEPGTARIGRAAQRFGG